jgi:diadenosine tetraphosphate (Ap4A) HIT family hydrolase
MIFELDARLAGDTFLVGDLELCRVLLMNDARYPWLILVPRHAGIVELTDLDARDRARLIEEAHAAAAFLRLSERPDKINIATLGNVVRQFHLHVVARRLGDPAWPGPVWGHGAAKLYEPEAARRFATAARLALAAG